jgi:UrcA family protein
MYRSISILAAAAIVSSASPAFAQELHTASVTISESDFATAQGRAGLQHRVQRAVEELCGVNAMAEGESWKKIKECQADVRQQFNRQIAAAKTSREIQLSAR